MSVIDSTIDFNLSTMFCKIEITTNDSTTADNLLASSLLADGTHIQNYGPEVKVKLKPVPMVIYSE